MEDNLKSGWKKVGKDFASFGKDFGKTFVKTVKKGVSKATEWADKEEKPDEKADVPAAQSRKVICVDVPASEENENKVE